MTWGEVDTIDLILFALALGSIAILLIMLIVSRRHRRMLVRLTFEVERENQPHEPEQPEQPDERLGP